MKCEQAEQAILLKDSGELGAWGRFQLGRHLQGCPACQAFQSDLRATRSALQALPAPALSARARTAILDAAQPDRRETITLAPTLSPVSWWRPALAAAILVLMLASGLYLSHHQTAHAPALAQQTTPASPAVAANQDDAVDAEMDALEKLMLASLDESGTTNTAALPDEDTLARELLALQETTL